MLKEPLVACLSFSHLMKMKKQGVKKFLEIYIHLILIEADLKVVWPNT